MHLGVWAGVVFLVFGMLWGRTWQKVAGDVKGEQVPKSTEVIPTTTKKPTPQPTIYISVSNNRNNNTEVSRKLTITVSDNSDEWRYPGANKIGDGRYEMEADAKMVTDWYKNQIKNRGYNTRSFVSTSTNGKIDNKLVGANTSGEISVEIKN